MASPHSIYQEPSLDEMLSEPIVQLVMASDGVTCSNVETLVGTMHNGRHAHQESCGNGRVEHETGSMEPQVFDAATNLWLDEIMAELNCDRQLAWQLLGAVLQGLRKVLPIDLSAHLGSQLPVLIRGSYYGQGDPSDQPLDLASRDGFLEDIARSLAIARPMNVHQAVRAVFRTISRHVTDGHVRKVRDCLSMDLAAMWPHGVGAPRLRRSFRGAEQGSSTQGALAHAGAISGR